MTKRRGERRRRKRDDVPYLAGIGLADYFVLEFVLAPRYGVAIAILLWFVMLMVWVLFIMPTRCDFDVGGRGCRWPVYGKLNGCHYPWPRKAGRHVGCSSDEEPRPVRPNQVDERTAWWPNGWPFEPGK